MQTSYVNDPHPVLLRRLPGQRQQLPDRVGLHRQVRAGRGPPPRAGRLQRGREGPLRPGEGRRTLQVGCPALAKSITG